MKSGVLVPDGSPEQEPGFAARTVGTTGEPPDDDYSRTVLVVDDDSRLRDLLCTVLATLGEVVSVGSGEEALTELLQRKVAVIVLDINMPGMNGFETAQLIRDTEDTASTPIIFLTGQTAQDSDPQRGYDLGAVDFLVKPVSRQVLYAKVKALLELDRSFARLRSEAARFHEQQLQAARSAEARQREELAFTQRRERLTNVFAEASIDLASLEKTIAVEFSHLFDADCALRLSSPGGGSPDSLSNSVLGNPVPLLESWLAEPPGSRSPCTTAYPEMMVEELTARGRPVGVVCVGRADGTAFSGIESALFRGVAIAAALAVSNATLYRVQAEYAAVMQATGDAILAVDASGSIRSCNRAAATLFGWAQDALIGRSILEFADAAFQEHLQEQLDNTPGRQREVSMEMVCVSRDGRQADVVLTLSPIGDSVELRVAAVVHDLSEIKRAQRKIKHLASHDPLTDLANRRELNEQLASLALRQGSGHGLVALLYMDVNQFKLVNDTYGHDTGDELLMAVSARLRAAVPSGTLVCRIGGDEFVVVLEDVSSSSAAVSVGNKILKLVEAELVHCRNVDLRPSLSMGVSCLGGTAHTPEELLSQADLAMFDAKKNRLDECVAYTDRIGSRHQEKARLRAMMSDAIIRSDFRLAYQPIVNAATGALFGVEALIRWRVEDEDVSAAEIVSLAEDFKQMGALGRWILRRSFHDYVALGRNDVQLHVNLSPDQVFESDFLDDLVSAYQDSGIDPANVCLELIEHTFNRDPLPAYAALRQARDIGFSLAIDDFGVEYASMTNLLNLPVNWLKIDGSFIAEVGTNERVQQLVRGQIAIASSMGVNLIAEGVENQEQADWLREAGCVLHQGHMYAHPTEVEDLADLVERLSAHSADQCSNESEAQ